MVAEQLALLNEDALLLEPRSLYDKALVGVCISRQIPIALYSVKKLLWLIMQDGECSYQDAREHFEYNMVGSCTDDNHPVFLEDELESK